MDEKAKLIRDYARMCKSKIGIDCDECELNKNKKYSSCELFMMKEPEKAVEIIEEWSAEHPIKTRQSEFLEQYPEVAKDEHGVIDIAPCAIEKSRFRKNSERICNTPEKSCKQCRNEYWNEEVE